MSAASNAVLPLAPSPAATAFCLLVFDARSLVAASVAADGVLGPTVGGRAAAGRTLDDEAAAAATAFAGVPTRAVRVFSMRGEGPAIGDGAGETAVYLALLDRNGGGRTGLLWTTLADVYARLESRPATLSPALRALVPALKPHVIRIPYLNIGENDYVYRFRTDEQRNRAVYSADARARGLYQSTLCEAIKAARRQRERTAAAPAVLDFGPVRHVLPSHFGFCLGVQNAIERAYETIAANPGRRVYMLSELIHNPFVNADLHERGLIYLQSDRGVPFQNPATGRAYWDELVQDDIVLTPAFGATDEDKVRLIEKGIAVNRYDATCMLVEKVWKAARRFALAGYTVVIHGKSEHEETKATFSNCAKFGPSLVIRDRHEAELLGEIILAPARAQKEALFAVFAGKHTPGFDVERDLDRLAVVNQTTLLRNETVGIIDHLEGVMVRKFGADAAAGHMHGKSRGDTLCYATQVNQDALARAIAVGADAALVVGGRNSSNTYQLFRLCAAAFGERASYIQSERAILSRERVLHYIFPAKPGAPGAGETVERPFLPAGDGPFTVLITGGASCPDGVIQQVIGRINSLFPPERLRPIEAVLAEIESES